MTGLGHKLNYVLNTLLKRTPGQISRLISLVSVDTLGAD